MKNLIKVNSSKAGYILFCILVTLTAAVFLTSNSRLPAADGNARISFTEVSHDFGKVKQGPQLRYSFKFTNEGDKALLIEKVQTSCGCTGATVGDKVEYAEGESGEIKITFNTQGREGHQEKHVTVMTNDKENPSRNLTFTCDIESSI